MPLFNIIRKHRFKSLGFFLFVIALFSILTFRRPPEISSLHSKQLNSLVEVSAEEVAQFLDGKGTVVLLSPESDNLSTNFKRAITRQGLRVVAVEWLEEKTDVTPGFFPGARLLAIPEKYPNVDAVISLGGLPLFQDDMIQTTAHPTFIAVYGVFPEIHLKELIQNGVVSFAIVPTFSQSVPPEPSKSTLREQFDQYYHVVTAENVDQQSYYSLPGR